MPQVFQVLRCYQCSTFQSHQTKKSNKWDCRLCGKKQSFKRYYGLGTAKECRFQVIKLNGMRGQLESTESHTDQDSDSNSADEETDWAIEPVKDTDIPITSKWQQYLEKMGPIEPNSITNSSGGEEVASEIPEKQRKLDNKSFKTNPTFSTIEVSPVMPDDIDNLDSTESKPPQLSFHPKKYHPAETFNEIKPNIKKFVPVVIKKSSTPDLTEQKFVPVVIKKSSTPDLTEQKFVPVVIKKSSTPDLTEQKFVPVVIKKSSTPDLTEQKFVPVVIKKSSTPDLTEQKFVPVVIKKSSTPEITEQKFVPAVIKKSSTPDLTEQKFVPVVIKKSSTPDLTEQTSLLPPFENLDGLCSDSMMAKPFTWSDDTNDLDALNI